MLSKIRLSGSEEEAFLAAYGVARGDDGAQEKLERELDDIPPEDLLDLILMCTSLKEAALKLRQRRAEPGCEWPERAAQIADKVGDHLTEHGVDVAQVAKREMRDEPEGYVRSHYVGDWRPGGDT